MDPYDSSWHQIISNHHFAGLTIWPATVDRTTCFPIRPIRRKTQWAGHMEPKHLMEDFFAEAVLRVSNAAPWLFCEMKGPTHSEVKISSGIFSALKPAHVCEIHQ